MPPKNIVLCCDGTGNQFGDANSNVVKLYTALLIHNDQVGYYHPGVGTMGAPQARSALGRAWSIVKGLTIAAGFMENVEDAYRYLMETYNQGDRIYLIGFSRGAYTVRALAAILHGYGLLCKGNQGQIPYLFRLFTSQMSAARKHSRRHSRRDKPASNTSIPIDSAFKETFSQDVTLHFVGLWDTVSSVGWIAQPLRLLYSAQNPIIQTGRHAVSIDERRAYYQDNLWGPALPLTDTPTQQRPQDILQVWFPGVHSDIGGSYPQLESALSNHSLRWLLDEAIEHGLQVAPDRVNLIFGLPAATPHAAASLYATPPEPGIVHPSPAGGWWLLEVLPHRYYVMDTDQEKWRIPFGASRRLPTGAIVHPSVVHRIADTTTHYAPRNLVTAGTLTPIHTPGTQPGTTTNLTGYYTFTPNP